MPEEWNLYETALILEVDTQTGSTTSRLEYKTPPEARATEQSSVLFKAGAVVGEKMYTCTPTEVLILSMSSPDSHFPTTFLYRASTTCIIWFQTLMGTCSWASTGLDMVLRVDASGKVLQEWNTLGQNPWGRSALDVHYRKVKSTKPCPSHPNFAFKLKGQIWVTRFEQRDAICLTEPRKRIDIAIEAPHGGHVCGEYIHFTTVDGHIVFAGRDSLQVERAVDLAAVNGREMLLGAEVFCASTRTSSGSDLCFLAQSHASQSHAEEAHTHRAIRYLRRDVPPRIQPRAIRHETSFSAFCLVRVPLRKVATTYLERQKCDIRDLPTKASRTCLPDV
jgi:hypothetical protein